MQMQPGSTSNSMTMGQIVYWHHNQVTITLFSHLPTNAPAEEFNQTVMDNLTEINTSILGDSKFRVTLPTPTQRPAPDAHSMNTTSSTRISRKQGLLPGVYIYSSPAHATQKLSIANIATFARIIPAPSTTGSPGEMANMDQEAESEHDQTLHIVKKINEYHKKTGHYLASPNWLWSGVPTPIHGCPVSPPFPAAGSGETGLWKITLPTLPDPLNDATGAGVNIFILDTLPDAQQITEAAQMAGDQNTLLQSMAQNMVTTPPYQATPPAISLNYSYPVPDADASAVTGKDIYGRLSGFPMADHGLFIAGMIRDIDSAANIECIRILNDYGVGDIEGLTDSLADIEVRLQSGGDLHGQPVVINLSMVVGPPEADEAVLDGQSLPLLLTGLRSQMQSLSALGVIFVASVGNDSDPRDFTMNPDEVRFGPRYPAAFAYEMPPMLAVLPVGALSQVGEPTIYSNYPGTYGLAATGGGLPRPVPWVPEAMMHKIAEVDQRHLDTLRGIYTSTTYPALSRNDQYPVQIHASDGYPLYPAPQTNAWSCWSGTSFAAPVMAALAARVLETSTGPVDGQAVHDAIAAISGQTLWTGLESGPDVYGPAFSITQEWQAM